MTICVEKDFKKVKSKKYQAEILEFKPKFQNKSTQQIISTPNFPENLNLHIVWLLNPQPCKWENFSSLFFIVYLNNRHYDTSYTNEDLSFVRRYLQYPYSKSSTLNDDLGQTQRQFVLQLLITCYYAVIILAHYRIYLKQ